MTHLSSMRGSQLPPLAYAHAADHDLSLTQPGRFRPIACDGFLVKPSGGLWTAPVTEQDSEGLPLVTSWIDWCRSEGWGADSYVCLTEIFPSPAARVLVIDTLADLHALVEAFPKDDPLLFHTWLSIRYPDWAALANNDAGWDAVYLTGDGQWATRLPPSGPNLYSWDVATVLWLQPAYTVGRTVTLAPAEREVAW